MLLKPDQERVKVLLKDTMTLLCKNGLEFEGKFRIEALVGITLDDKNVFLMNFDEIIKSDQYRTPRNSDDEIKSSKHSSRKRRRFAKELKTPHSDSKSHSSDNDVCSEEEKIETNTEDEASSVPMKRTQPSASDDIVIIKDEANDWDDYQEDEQQMEFPQFNAPSQSANSHGNQEGLQLSGMMLEEVSNQEDQEMWPQKSIGNLTSTPGQSMNFSGLSDGAQQKKRKKFVTINLTPKKTSSQSTSKTTPSPIRSTRLAKRKGKIVSVKKEKEAKSDTGTPTKAEEDKRVIVKEENLVTYEIYEGASKQGKDLLIESSGYSYTMKVLKGEKTRWRCSVRNGSVTCGASLMQDGDRIIPGSLDHCHPADPNARTTVRLRMQVMSRVLQNENMPVVDIVKDVLKEQVESFTETLPSSVNLARAAERMRRKSMGDRLVKPERRRIEEEDGELIDSEETAAVEELVGNGEPGTSQSIRPVTYEILKGGTARGKDKLVDNIGYTYNLKRDRGGKRSWWCSIRNGKINCPASCVQIGNQFRRGCLQHVHKPDLEETKKFRASAQVKAIVKDNTHVKLDDVLNHVIQVDETDPEAQKAAKQVKANLKSRARRFRRKLRTTNADYEIVSSVTVEEPVSLDISRDDPSSSLHIEAEPSSSLHSETDPSSSLHSEVDPSSSLQSEAVMALPSQSINCEPLEIVPMDPQALDVIQSVSSDHQYETVQVSMSDSQAVVHQYEMPNQDMVFVYMEQ